MRDWSVPWALRAAALDAAAAVLVYHAMAFWIPRLGGMLAYARCARAWPPRLSAWLIVSLGRAQNGGVSS